LPGAPKEDGDREPTTQRSKRWRYGCDGRNPDGRQGFHPAPGDPHADAFEEGAPTPCSMGLWVPALAELRAIRGVLEAVRCALDLRSSAACRGNGFRMDAAFVLP
jgi:hypothetical protein